LRVASGVGGVPREAGVGCLFTVSTEESKGDAAGNDRASPSLRKPGVEVAEIVGEDTGGGRWRPRGGNE